MFPSRNSNLRLFGRVQRQFLYNTIKNSDLSPNSPLPNARSWLPSKRIRIHTNIISFRVFRQQSFTVKRPGSVRFGSARFHHLPAKHRPHLHKQELRRHWGQIVKAAKSNLPHPKLETNRTRSKVTFGSGQSLPVKPNCTNKLFIHADHSALTSSTQTYTAQPEHSCDFKIKDFRLLIFLAIKCRWNK